jgi:hypothetical protein
MCVCVWMYVCVWGGVLSQRTMGGWDARVSRRLARVRAMDVPWIEQENVARCRQVESDATNFQREEQHVERGAASETAENFSSSLSSVGE